MQSRQFSLSFDTNERHFFINNIKTYAFFQKEFYLFFSIEFLKPRFCFYGESFRVTLYSARLGHVHAESFSV